MYRDYMFNLCGLYHKTYNTTRIQPFYIVLDGWIALF